MEASGNLQGHELANGVYVVTDPRFATQTRPDPVDSPTSETLTLRFLIAASLILLAVLALFVVVKRRA